jgi:hypothetical protein
MRRRWRAGFDTTPLKREYLLLTEGKKTYVAYVCAVCVLVESIVSCRAMYFPPSALNRRDDNTALGFQNKE